MKTKVISMVCFALAVMFMFVGGVKAKVYTIDELSSSFNNSKSLKDLNETFDSTIVSSVDSTNKKLNIYFNDDYTVHLNYTDEYIEYDGRNIPITEDNVSSNFLTSLSAFVLISAVAEDLGYDNIDFDEESIVDYDTYGLVITTEPYELSGGEEGNTWTSSGTAIKYFKMSLDSEKIEKLIEDFGKEVGEEENVFEFLVPIVSIGEITNNSVGVTVTTPKNDISETPMCYIYRSTSAYGEYEKISDWAVNCDDDGIMTITDDGLEENTTYYYKAIVNGGSNFSDIIAVTTKSSIVEKANNVSNPKTGINTRLNLIISLFIVSSLVVLLFLNKKYANE